MACLTKKSIKFYKSTLMDVWDYYSIYGKSLSLMKYMKMMTEEKEARSWHFKSDFVYSFKKKLMFKSLKSLKKKWLLPSMLKHYYLVLKLSHFSSFSWKAVKQLGCYEENYLNFMEGSVFMMIHSANFVTNLFMMKSLFELGLFTMNYERKYHTLAYAKPGDLIGIIPKYTSFISHDLSLSYKLKMVTYFYPPEYLFVNYKLMFILFLTKPRLKFINFPVSNIDVFIGIDYYMPSVS